MKATKRLVTIGMLIAVLSLSSTFANAGIIVNFDGQTRQSTESRCQATDFDSKSRLARGVIVNLTGVIVNFTGVIVNLTGVIVNLSDDNGSICGHIPTNGKR